MSSNPERGLITAIIDNEEASDWVAFVRTEWFFDPETRRAWNIISSHYQDHRETITRPLLREQLPGFTFEHWSGSVEAMAEAVQERYIRNRAIDIAERWTDELEGDPRVALASMVGELASLQAAIVREEGADIAATVHDSVDRYHYRKEHKGELGLPWPWAPLQKSTNGAKNGSYNLIYARAKQMKTYVAMVILRHWVYHHHRKCIAVSREMGKEEVQDRWLCLWAGVDSARFDSGELTEHEEQLIADAADAVEEVGHFYVESVEGYGTAAVAEIDALCEQYELEAGDILWIDGGYFFAENSDWTNFRSFSQSLRQLLLRRKVILLMTTQSNRAQTNKLDSDAGAEVGLGDAPIQDCTLAMKLKLFPQEQHMLVMVNTVRDGMPCQFTINAKPCTDFTLKFSEAPDLDDKQPKGRVIGAPVIGKKPKP